jgi:hypothetical protein
MPACTCCCNCRDQGHAHLLRPVLSPAAASCLPAPAAVAPAEIQGCIKGSEGSLASAKGRLSKQQYMSLAERRCSNLSDDQRLAVYKVFTRWVPAMRCL